MSSELSISIGPEPDAWVLIDAAVEEFASKQDWPVDLDFQVRMMLEELVLNVLMHGNSHGKSAISLAIKSDEDRIKIDLSDNGPEFNPLQDAPAPDLDSNMDERPIGGLGVHLIKTMADHVSYMRSDNRNRLQILKNRVG